MKKAHLLSAMILGLTALGVQAAEPEFKKNCTMGMAMKKHILTDCSVMWNSENGKTYCFGDQTAKEEFLKDTEGNLKKAEIFWSQPEAH